MLISRQSSWTAPCGHGSDGPERGFTLVELLISITLVAAISAGMLTALHTGLLTMDKITKRLDDNRRALGIERVLTRQLGGAIPGHANCPFTEGVNVPLGIFNGNSQTLRLVTSYSMDEGARGYPRLLEYQVVHEQGGTVRLIVNEYPYTGSETGLICSGTQPARVMPQSFVVSDRLAYCRILYREFRDAELIKLGGKWVSEWTGPELPAGVRIEMEPAAPDASRLPLGGVTVSLRITREAQMPYVDP